MKSVDVAKIDRDDPRLLVRAALVAAVIEFVVLTFLGINEHWLAHPQTTKGVDASKFIAAEVFQIPKESHLVADKPVAPKAPKEVAISKRVSDVKRTDAQPAPMQNENQTESGAAVAADHGPVAIVAPPPVIPPYLQDKDISSSVVIEFLVNNQGQTTARLIGSSGNDELDAIALETVKKWQFRPAEVHHKPTDAKVRLRINFDVH